MMGAKKEVDFNVLTFWLNDVMTPAIKKYYDVLRPFTIVPDEPNDKV